MATKSSVEQLNRYLRGEMAAVETYEMALARIDHISTARDELLINLKSHEDRVILLRDAIVQCGGTPSEGSGPWGVFAKAVEGGARLFGEKAAVAALAQGEDNGLADYQREDADLDPTVKTVLATKLIPLQQLTFDRATALKKRV